VEPDSGSSDSIQRLIDKGVTIRSPLTVDIGREVDVDNISGNGVTIYPGCRIYGDKTAISAGACIGREGPATIENCQIGPGVELGSGYFNMSVFLEGSSMGPGAQVREACILEEQAGGAHCVGLKQTILFPFVTLGSLINFCDCLMAGGTSRKNHSEVGSSYIHFNFTPDGDKATASLMGDVPRGVMLNQPPIFLGGQGGMIGPLRLGFGSVVAAGCILRKDVLEENKLIFGRSHAETKADFSPRAYPRLSRIVGNNLLYLANLAALEQWYIHVRQAFFREQELGELVYRGVLEKLALAVEERLKRLEDLAGKLSISTGGSDGAGRDDPARRELRGNARLIRELLAGDTARKAGGEHRSRFLDGLQEHGKGRAGYIETIQGLPAAVSLEGTAWLGEIIDGFKRRWASLLPSMGDVLE
jgi:bifunctional UDP-N-acetylglucosamine pyrophosphorylase/glucosamine-1-phosphate N-acetyltransferase